MREDLGLQAELKEAAFALVFKGEGALESESDEEWDKGE